MWETGMPEWLEYGIYIFAGISILLAVGGFKAYSDTKDPGLLLSSVVSLVFSSLAIGIPHWWPLLVGFTLNILIARAFPRFAYAPLPNISDSIDKNDSE